MKMVKSLLLGTAAGLVAIAGAQAADLPVKAKPVQYVKICSLYGAGFYYIPGTDMCLKVGGWVRQQVGYGLNGSLSSGALVANLNTRNTQDFANRSRGYLTMDARNQTEYGTVRSYIAVGLSTGAVAAGSIAAGDPAAGQGGFSANRAFIQFAGFTFGISQSFFDFYSGPATSFFGANINPSEDSGDAGKAVTAYTAQFGNGMSASLSIEGQRNAGVFTPTSSVPTSTAAPGSEQRAEVFPDVIANLRIDQAWGSAQVMGALHDASGQYVLGTNNNGSPSADNVIGWAVGAGIKLLAPMIGAGDYFQAEVNYAQGATGYTNVVPAMYSRYGSRTSYGFGFSSDNVIGSDGGNNLTTAWGVNAAYEHFWSKSYQTSVYGGYIAESYNDNANATLCSLSDFSSSAQLGGGFSNCDNNWAMWNVGSRSQWNIDSQTALGVDIVYQKVISADKGLAVMPVNGTQAAGLHTIEDQGAWMGQFRIHRNFYP
jgi:hypothetical protein